MSQQSLPNQNPGYSGRPGYYGVPPASTPVPARATPVPASAPVPAGPVPAGFAPAGPVPAGPVSAGLPPGDGPIPVAQEAIVLRRWSTPSSAFTTAFIVIVIIATGVLLLVWSLSRLTSGGSGIGHSLRIVSALLLGLPYLLLLAAVPFMLSRRTVLDAHGIHVRGVFGSSDHPWPASRRSLHVHATSSVILVDLLEAADGIGCLIVIVMVVAAFLIVKRAKIVMVTPEGRTVRLTDPTRVGFLRRRLEAKGTRDLDRIWAWAVARGYTRETGRYTELRDQ